MFGLMLIALQELEYQTFLKTSQLEEAGAEASLPDMVVVADQGTATRRSPESSSGSRLLTSSHHVRLRSVASLLS
jgi:hypothetical protein